jgi:transposase-like protein
VDTLLEGVPSRWESKMGKRHRRKFTDEFKAETVKLIRESGRPVASVARELDLTETAVRSWVKRSEASGSAETLSPDERAELRRLRKENRELRMEKEILRKATAFFAKESR